MEFQSFLYALHSYCDTMHSISGITNQPAVEKIVEMLIYLNHKKHHKIIFLITEIRDYYLLTSGCSLVQNEF